MPSLTTTLVASAALALSASSVLAAPAGCTTLGSGPIGFNVSSIQIYNDAPPAVYATFQGHRTADGFQYLQPSNTPEVFDFVSCQTTLQPGLGKSASGVYEGYIASRKAPGYCLQATNLGGNDERIISKPCNFINGDTSKHQNFQFSTNTFFDYKVIDFLGAARGVQPYTDDTYHFAFRSSGAGYRYSIVGKPGAADSFLRLSYDPSSKHPGPAGDLAFNKAWTQAIQ